MEETKTAGGDIYVCQTWRSQDNAYPCDDSWTEMIAGSKAFDFLRLPEEDIYDEGDVQNGSQRIYPSNRWSYPPCVPYPQVTIISEGDVK